MLSFGMSQCLVLVKTDFSEKLIASIIRVKGISEPRFLQEPHGVIPEKTVFFIITNMKTSNLTKFPFFVRYMVLVHASV
jgi:hypothetical protein